MLFNSLDFLLFLGPVLLLQWWLPHRPRNLFLLLASYFFYGCWDWRFLGLIWLSTVVDWLCGQRVYTNCQSAQRSSARRWLTLSVAVNLSILGFFKYFDFFVGSALELMAGLGWSVPEWQLRIILPVGISFYTFQTISYSIDIYRGQLKPADRFLDFALFVAFFPQLVAGPIEKAKQLLPQLQCKPVVGAWQWRLGVWLFCWGLFKKVVIADNVGQIADQGFATDGSAAGLAAIDLWVAIWAFAIQIYCDFSGYSDMARGIAKMMGYELTVNFRIPYMARSPAEFFRRWHISLMSWFRDYVYIPLGGNRNGWWRAGANAMLVMVLSGLWHGAAWNFVLWGAYLGALLWLQQALTGFWRRGAAVFVGQSQWRQWFVSAFRIGLTFQLICIGWLLFRAQSLQQIADLLPRLLLDWQFSAQAGYWLWQIAVYSWLLVLVQMLQLRTANLSAPLLLAWPLRLLLYVSMGVGVLVFANTGAQSFIYFQF